MTNSIYLKTNKDYNNVFSEDGKILKVWRCLWVCPICPPWQLFQLGQKHTISNFRGGHMHRWSICPPLFWNRGGICTLCPSAAHDSGAILNVIHLFYQAKLQPAKQKGVQIINWFRVFSFHPLSLNHKTF